ncbi:MAG: hypothetical protein LBQ93_11870 [Treponema sp.]|nr:hypothetical protein [Treponema sp.]
MEANLSSITCVADMNISGILDQCLTDLGLPEVFIQPAKQMSLSDNQGFLGLRPTTSLAENRAFIYRITVPSEYEAGMVHRIAETTDLKMGGRGCMFAKNVNINRGAPLAFDTEKLDRLCGRSSETPADDHVLACCTVPRGGADALARAVLDLGICVPIIFFGEGMGLRDKLGLMRITIPVEKEIIWFIAPRSDEELVEKTIIPRARLDIPGRGFLYKCYIRSPVVNLRIRQGKRVHAATMEQVIAALDDVQGSRDWRRLGSKPKESEDGEKKTVSFRGLFFIGDEKEVELFRRTAMDNGARGATFNSVEKRSYSNTNDRAMESNSRQLCDIIASQAVEDRIKEAITKIGLFDNDKTCVFRTFDVEMPVIMRHMDSK